MRDHPLNVFLVLRGTFACVGRPKPRGGMDDSLYKSMPMCVSKAISVSSIYTRDGMAIAKESPFQSMEHHLYPYLLISSGGHFGDLEVMEDTPRRFSVRSETDSSVLVMSRNEFDQLAEEYPHFRKVWRAAALQREVSRRKALKRLTRKGVNYT